jgi:hypothetical protein
MLPFAAPARRARLHTEVAPQQNHSSDVLAQKPQHHSRKFSGVASD